MSKNHNVSCPNCGKPARYSPDNPWRPFCCERCKLIDLGEWFSEKRVIAGDEQPQTLEPDDTPLN